MEVPGARHSPVVARLVYQAKLAEQAERFEEMAKYMDEVIKRKKMLDPEEQKLFAIAYKNCVGRLRTALRLVQTARARYAGSNKHKEEMAREYGTQLKDELERLCERVMANVNLLLESPMDPPTRMRYAKMEADYLRYRAEMHPTTADIKRAADAFQRAVASAKGVPASDPTRMGIELNYAVFKYELENQPEEACGMARQALMNARADGIRGRDAYLIEQILQDNISIWESEQATNKEQMMT